MRAQENPVHMDMYKMLGVQAVAKPVSEVIPALNTGIVDGFDNTALFSLAAGWLEPVSHYTLSRHIYQPAAVVYSKSFVDSLPPDLQKVVIGDPMAESARGRAAVRALEGELLDTIRSMGKQVVDLTPEQRGAKGQTVYPHDSGQQPRAHPRVQAGAGQAGRLAHMGSPLNASSSQ